ncbi:MAG: UDP-N-acetylglucosamine 2-epimerase (non-hydrolyzing) [Bradyrhizobium sp.]|nr:MAG: UDP-N-acetylglucosamine 2-epimerase (non-hydrolyzing) [Bradyrhizobium sp.]
MTKHILVVIGTRPEALKLFPLIHKLKAREDLQTTVCVTAQHRDLLDPILALAKITPEFDLDVMKPNQSLDQLTARLLIGLGEVFDRVRPDRVVVQGDTTSAMTGALAAYYRRIPVSHVEAGLRSANIYEPWPEEVNRKIITQIADQHFAPTARAAERLREENVPASSVHVTGNTIIDALLAARAIIDADPALPLIGRTLAKRHEGRRIVLATCHRRENFGDRMQEIGDAFERILERPDVALVLPLHPNPNVRDVLGVRLAGRPRAEIIPPQDYLDFVSLLAAAHLVLTDSGGVQEEAPAFGKPVLVMRETTERPEGVEAGTACLVGSNADRIVGEVNSLLDDGTRYQAMARAHNPFGDGRASEIIARIIAQ